MSTALATWLDMPPEWRAVLLLAVGVSLAGGVLTHVLRHDAHSLRVGWPTLLFCALLAGVLSLLLGLPPLRWLPATPSSVQAGRVLDPGPLLWLWCSGSVLLLLRLVAGCCRAGWRARRADVHPEARVQRFFDELRPHIAPRTRPRVQLSDDGAQCCGFWRPCIQLPLDVSLWSDSQLRAVLVHELTHARRCDTWLLALVGTCEALLWPLFWCRFIGRSWHEALEASCDADVVAWLGDRDDYARALMGAARQRARVWQRVVTLLGGSFLQRRIRLILGGHRPGDLATAPIYWATVALLALAVLTAALSPGARPPEPWPGQVVFIDLRTAADGPTDALVPPWLQTIEAMRPASTSLSVRPKRFAVPRPPPTARPRPPPD